MWGEGGVVCLFVRPSVTRDTFLVSLLCYIKSTHHYGVMWAKNQRSSQRRRSFSHQPTPLSPCPPVPVPRPSVSQLANKWPTYRCQHEHVSSLNKRRPLLAFLAECRSQFSRPAQHSCQDTRQRARLTPRLLTGRKQMLLSAALPKLQDHSYDASALKRTFHIYFYVKPVQK